MEKEDSHCFPPQTSSGEPKNHVEPDQFCYPQPSREAVQPYQYTLIEKVRTTYFDELVSRNSLVWVMLSGGRQKSPKIFQRARTISEYPDKEDRILVQYPKGSTYRVRRSNLLPVLDQHFKNIILVASETSDYRRASIVHTCVEDHFIEIGCDFGINVASVDAKTSLGIDKSEESINVAKQKYPDQKFLLGDIFDDGDLLKKATPKIPAPLVVAIDINGNRELLAVINCIQLCIDSWSPRIIIVKSRELHAKMVKDEEYNALI